MELYNLPARVGYHFFLLCWVDCRSITSRILFSFVFHPEYAKTPARDIPGRRFGFRFVDLYNAIDESWIPFFSGGIYIC